MSEKQQHKTRANEQRVRLTACLTLYAYDALIEMKRRYRRRTSRELSIWKILNTAVLVYAKK